MNARAARAHGVVSAAAALWQPISPAAAHAGCPTAPQTCSLHQPEQIPAAGMGSSTSLHFPGLSLGRFPATRMAFLHRSASEAPGNPALYLGCGEFPWALPSELKR